MSVAHADEDAPAQGQGPARGDLGFGIGDAEVRIQAHDFSGRTHFGREQNVLPVKTAEGEYRFFDGPIRGNRLQSEPQLLQALASHDSGCELRQRNSDRLADERHRPRGARVDLQNIDRLAFHRVLNVHQADHH